MDRHARIDWLVDHYNAPRHKGRLENADVSMPGGNPGCGDVITMHVKADADGRITGLSFEGEGCTISQAAASVLTDLVLRRRMTLDEVRAISYSEMMEILGKDVVSSRPRCATLALGTLKAAGKRLESSRRLAARDGVKPPAAEPQAEEEAGLVFGEGAVEAAASDRPFHPPDPLD